jgi:hypothetical protein
MLCWVGGTFGHLQKFLHYTKYIILELNPSTILLYLLLPQDAFLGKIIVCRCIAF